MKIATDEMAISERPLVTALQIMPPEANKIDKP